MYAVMALYCSCGLLYRTKGKRYAYYLAMAQMSDAEISNLTRGHAQAMLTPPTNLQTKFN